MKIAIPVANDKLCMHFGHCEKFFICDIKDKQVVHVEFKTPPPHEPGVLPTWIAEEGVDLVIAGGMGGRAQELFRSKGVEVLVGVSSYSPEVIVESWLKGELTTEVNACDH